MEVQISLIEVRSDRNTDCINLFLNSMKLERQVSPSQELPTRQILASKSTVTKSFLRNSLGCIQLPTPPKDHKSTSIGKRWQQATYPVQEGQTKMTHSHVFTRSHFPETNLRTNSSAFATKSSHNFCRRLDFKEPSESKKLTTGQVPILSFTKTPKSSQQLKTGHEQDQQPCWKTARVCMELDTQPKSQNSDVSNTFKMNSSVLDYTSYASSKSKKNSKASLSRLVGKQSIELEIGLTSPRECLRRGNSYSDGKQSPVDTQRGEESLPTHSHTREIGGGTFSNSYPTNNPFLKFKTQDKVQVEFKRAKILSHFSSHTEVDQVKSYGSHREVSGIRSEKIQKGDFEVGKRLGKGKYGDVFMVRHRHLGFVCAMKIIEKSLVKREKVEHQLCRQIKILMYLKQSDIVSLYGWFHDQQNVYLLMQLCSSGNLFRVLKQRKRLTEIQTVTVIKQLCGAVESLHAQHIIHRDIKPQNIILENGLVKLCDFGWSVYSQDRLRSTFCGTPLYVSPEVLKGQDYDQKIDIWAIGILTYQLLVGRVPFKIDSEMDLSKIINQPIVFPTFVSVSELAQDFILKILNRQASDRVDIEEVVNHPFLKQQCPALFFTQ